MMMNQPITMTDELNTLLISIQRELAAVQEKFKFFGIKLDELTDYTHQNVEKINGYMERNEKRNNFVDGIVKVLNFLLSPVVVTAMVGIAYMVWNSIYNKK